MPGPSSRCGDSCVQVLCWRAAASVAWSVLLLPASTAAFVVLSKLSVLHPVQMFAGVSAGSGRMEMFGELVTRRLMSLSDMNPQIACPCS